MSIVYKINDSYSLMECTHIRNKHSNKKCIRNSLHQIGISLGREILSKTQLSSSIIETPENFTYQGMSVNNNISIIITTKSDYKFLGKGLYSAFPPNNSYIGYIEQNNCVSTMCIPQLNQYDVVDNVIIAKSVIATGCTIITLVKQAQRFYTPNRICIASVFYTEFGLAQINNEFPHSKVFVVGEPDTLMEDNITLNPGIGHLDSRIL